MDLMLLRSKKIWQVPPHGVYASIPVAAIPHVHAFVCFSACLILVGLALIAGLKQIGSWVDAENYEGMFAAASSFTWSELFRDVSDPLYSALSKIAATCGLGFYQFVAVLAVLTVFVKAKAFAAVKTNHIALFAFYVTYLFWLHEYTQIRVALGLALALLAIYGNHGRLPLFLAGVLIHASVAMVVAAYYFLRFPRLGVVCVVIALLATFMAIQYFGFEPITIERAALYAALLDLEIFSEINLLAVMPMLQGAILLSCLLLNRPLETSGHQEYAFSWMSLLSFYMLSFLPPVAFRIHELFLPFFIILLSRVWNRSLVLILLSILYILSSIKTTFFGSGSLLFPGS